MSITHVFILIMISFNISLVYLVTHDDANMVSLRSLVVLGLYPRLEGSSGMTWGYNSIGSHSKYFNTFGKF